MLIRWSSLASRPKKSTDTQARATLEQLCKRWGCKDGAQIMNGKRAVPVLTVLDVFGHFEVWHLDGEQHGTAYKHKIYKKVE